MDYGSRRKRLISELDSIGVDALLVTRMTNIRYLTGFTGSTAFLLMGPTPTMIVDFRYKEQVSREVDGVEVQQVVSSRELWDATRQLLARSGLKAIATESDHLSVGRYLDLSSTDSIKWVPSQNLVEKLRFRKEPDEIKALREAVRIADEAVEEIAGVIRPGMTEHRVAGEIELLQRSKGGERSASEIIVASGPRSSLPHGIATDRVISAGEPIMLDLGTVFRGYLSDLTRTLHLGPAPKEFHRIYDIVFEAQRRAEARIKPGMTGREADAIAREYIASEGFGEHFGHSLGHSIGLDNHEFPLLSPYDNTVLEAGMVTTVEPGIYVKGVGGVRIEDMVLINETGCEVLSRSRKTLVEL
jgi:Xaa-Pro aminopeptidase